MGSTNSLTATRTFTACEANDEETVKANWEQLKLKEEKSVLEGVPKDCPVWSRRTASKTKFAALDLTGNTPVKWDKVKNFGFRPRWMLMPTAQRMNGDVLFALINYAHSRHQSGRARNGPAGFKPVFSTLTTIQGDPGGG